MHSLVTNDLSPAEPSPLLKLPIDLHVHTGLKPRFNEKQNLKIE